MKRNLLLAVTIAALAIAPGAFADTTGTSTLGVTLGAEATFSSVTSSVSLSAGDGQFGTRTGTTTFVYKIRTAVAAGGSITVAVAAFTGGGSVKPAVGDLSYTSTAGAQSGTAVSATTATTSATNVLTFGNDSHSADAGDTGTAVWTLTDRPTITAGAYSAIATFTIATL
jgi:hypothetical protein